ncbi:unnamed protein product [Brachionus calyciflorus]|uniref:Protein kinase domain-containing protein n=1 Tax=Brachionus calyciflorus TaxID=104777 RepID=A0A813M5Y0_9BILA|nr:unnamed protein product [Brachionus calyciflorus]
MKPKNLADLKGIDYYNLFEKFQLISQNDIEKIMDYFAPCFDCSKRTYLLALPTYQASRTIIEHLVNLTIPLQEFYECMLECGLHDICDWLAKNYPSDLTIHNLSLTLANMENDKSHQILNQNSAFSISQVNSNFSQTLNELDPTVEMTILFCEEILPVIYEKKAIDAQYTNVSSPKRYLDANSNKLFGYFQVCYIDERKLTYRKREFSDPISYIKELKMIKNRHLNLYTAESILKSQTLNKFSLLYNYDPVTTQLLRDYAEIYRPVSPSQYNTLQQLEILRDIACGLSFLHEKNDFKKFPILHSNLSPDSILIEIRGDNQVSAKIFDFVNSIELNGVDNYECKLRDEFYKFGQVIFMVATWRYLDRSECERLHFEQQGDEEIYIYELFKRFDMEKQPNKYKIHILLKMFYKLTSPDYDITKGIDKSYAHIKQQIQQLNEKKSMWPQ